MTTFLIILVLIISLWEWNGNGSTHSILETEQKKKLEGEMMMDHFLFHKPLASSPIPDLHSLFGTRVNYWSGWCLQLKHVVRPSTSISNAEHEVHAGMHAQQALAVFDEQYV